MGLIAIKTSVVVFNYKCHYLVPFYVLTMCRHGASSGNWIITTLLSQVGVHSFSSLLDSSDRSQLHSKIVSSPPWAFALFEGAVCFFFYYGHVGVEKSVKV